MSAIHKSCRGKKKAAGRQQRAQMARANKTRPPVPTSAIPDCLFLDPLQAEMRIRVRPPTERTRRRLVEVKDIPLPRGCFESFMEPLKDEVAHGLERDE
eukprot:1281640-Pleurochrysis_carterae.AAC.3